MIRALLLDGIEWTDRHQGLMLTCVLIVAFIAVCLDPLVPA